MEELHSRLSKLCLGESRSLNENGVSIPSFASSSLTQILHEPSNSISSSTPAPPPFRASFPLPLSFYHPPAGFVSPWSYTFETRTSPSLHGLGFSQGVRDSPNVNVNSSGLPHADVHVSEAATSNTRSPLFSYQTTNHGQVGRNNLLDENPVLSMALSPEGSKTLQSLLHAKEEPTTNAIFLQLVPHLFLLITHQHGSQAFRQLLDSCCEHQLTIILDQITRNSKFLIRATFDKYGANSIKRLVKLLHKSPLINKVTHVMASAFYEMMIDGTASYVLLKCSDTLDIQQNEILYKAAVNHSLDLARHEKGCISLNYFINSIRGQYRDQLLELLSLNSAFLSQDPSGNFVVQHILKLQHPVYTEIICRVLKGYYVQLSFQRGGSYIVEKCIKSTWMEHAIRDLINCERIVQLARDQYGNYVLQSALVATRNAGSPLYEELLKRIQPHLEDLRNAYGRNVLRAIVSLVN